MLKHSSLGMALIINIIIICLWDFISYIICKNIGFKYVDYRKYPFRVHKFERKGNFYRESFAIDYWYHFLPIKYNLDNINAKKIENADIPHLKKYLTVTCRSELCALINCLYFLFAIIANLPYLGFILGIFTILFNIPFIFANRYVRFFLLNEMVKKRRQKEILEYIQEKNPTKYDLDNF